MALAVASLAAVSVPAAADDEANVRGRLATVAEQMAANQQAIARLQAQVADRQQRIERERAQLRLLARAIYAQPDSTLVLVAQSPSLSDAVTRLNDLLSAGDRARSTKAALDRDLYALQSQRLELQAREASLEQQKADLDAEYARLVAQAEAAAAARRAAPPPPPAPRLPPAPAAAPAGDIPSLILAAWAPLGSATAQWAVRLVQCESGLNPYAVNRYSGAAGLFLFLAITWAGTPWRAQSPFDASANAQAAAWLYSKYGAGQWSCHPA